MTKIQFPIVELDNNRFQLFIDLSLYAKEAINATCYKYSHLYYIHQQVLKGNNSIIEIIFESKDGAVVTIDIPKQFCNDLIDQQLRFDTNCQFGKIRDRIVEEAFKPISK